MVKQQISDWPRQTHDAFKKALTEKDAAWCFEVPREKPISTHFQTDMYQRGRGRGRGRFKGRGPYSRSPYPNKNTQPQKMGCFNCGDHIHWKMNCPHEVR